MPSPVGNASEDRARLVRVGLNRCHVVGASEPCDATQGPHVGEVRTCDQWNHLDPGLSLALPRLGRPGQSVAGTPGSRRASNGAVGDQSPSSSIEMAVKNVWLHCRRFASSQRR